MSKTDTASNAAKTIFDTMTASGTMPTSKVGASVVGTVTKKMGVRRLIAKQTKGILAPLGLLAILRLPQIMNALYVVLAIACIVGGIILFTRRSKVTTAVEGEGSQGGTGTPMPVTRTYTAQQIQQRRERAMRRC